MIKWVESGYHCRLPIKIGEYWALKRVIDSVGVKLFWSFLKAEGEEMSSAGMGRVKLGNKVNFEGEKTRGSELFFTFVAERLKFGTLAEGLGSGALSSAIKKFLSSLMS